jgi:hypothetical protein
MSDKVLAKIQREAGKLAAQGFPFHSHLLLQAIETGTVASTAERVAIMLERGKRFAEAKRVRDLVAR